MEGCCHAPAPAGPPTPFTLVASPPSSHQRDHIQAHVLLSSTQKMNLANKSSYDRHNSGVDPTFFIIKTDLTFHAPSTMMSYLVHVNHRKHHDLDIQQQDEKALDQIKLQYLYL